MLRLGMIMAYRLLFSECPVARQAAVRAFRSNGWKVEAYYPVSVAPRCEFEFAGPSEFSLSLGRASTVIRCCPT